MDNRVDLSRFLFFYVHNRRNKSALLTERILESVAIPENSKSQRYVIGVIRDGQLHLTPLTSIAQMHNKLWYLNAADKMTKMAQGITKPSSILVVVS